MSSHAPEAAGASPLLLVPEEPGVTNGEQQPLQGEAMLSRRGRGSSGLSTLGEQVAFPEMLCGVQEQTPASG